MAGPAARVLLSFPKAIPTWRDLLSGYATEFESDGSFYIRAPAESKSDSSAFDLDTLRPFVGSVERFGVNVECEDGRAEAEAIEKTTGRAFTHAVGLAAMCKSDVDHRLLCATLGSIALSYSGFVDFDLLEAPYAELGMLCCQWLGVDTACWTVLGDSNACERWLSHPDFYMVN